MNLVLFIHKDASEKGKTLQDIIDRKFAETICQTLDTFNSFKTKLKEFTDFGDKEIFILLADSKKRLKELTLLIDLLEGKRLILILPDESKSSISIAPRFFPRFFTSVSHTYNDLHDVLNKMITLK